MKNIVIQSEEKDLSTYDVINWLKYLSKESTIIRINDSHVVDKIKIHLSNKDNLNIIINDNLEINKNTSYWYRRGGFDYPIDFLSEIQKKIKQESINPYVDFLNNTQFLNGINKFQDNDINKLQMLYEAIKLEIKIPEVLVTDNKSDLQSFIRKHSKVITKPITNPFVRINNQNHNIYLNTKNSLVELEAKDPNFFLSSYFQQYIEKKFEIRSFYLLGKFYSMAIFSQQNEKTKIDFRNYDRDKPNRLIPFKLPVQMEKKLKKLMKNLKLNCGSIDLIYTPNKEFYFLEVNPIGQFQWLSRNCNYFLEKEIAKKILFNE